MVTKVIADTSFLMVPGIFGVDILNEIERLVSDKHELVILTPVVKELEKLAKSGTPKERIAAKVGLEIVKRGKIVEAEGPADEAIFEFAKRTEFLVGTTDLGLRKKLRRSGVGVTYLRDKSHLALER